MHRAIEMGLKAHRLYPFLARLRDILLGTLALAFSTPLILVFGLAGKRSTGGSAVFRQVRVGKDGRHFTVDKLRTLSVEAPAGVQKKEAEHLATPLGKFMRRFKLDELPQFWNVVKGDMSLVGPRPIIPEEYSNTDTQLRLAVRPGVTGLWQLSRVREQRFDKNPEYDLFYLANRSMIFDLWLIWRTVLLIATCRETKIRMAARMWERNTAWRDLVPDRARSIPGRHGPLRSRIYLLAAAALLVVVGTPGMLVAMSARGDLLEAQESLLDARRAAVRLDPLTAKADLERARVSFAQADSKLSSWVAIGLKAIPGLNNNVEVPQSFARAGSSIVRAGSSGLELIEALPFEAGRPALSLDDGVLELDPFKAAEAPARRLQVQLERAQRQLNSTPGGFLLPPVREARDKGMALLSEAKAQADNAAAAAFLIPRLFGSDGPRRWVVGAENNAELRGRGGYIGSLGMLSSDGGRVELADFRPTSGLPRLPMDPTLQSTVSDEYFRQYAHLGGTVAWQNLLMSPDFPTGARTLLANLESVANMPADGLIALDPVALSYLLRATGPVNVPGIPEQLTADNVVEWSLNEIYFLEGQQDERKELLSVIASTVWSRLLSGPDLDAAKVAAAIGQAITERHLVIFSAREEEQKRIEELGIGGTLDSTDDDYLLLVGQNVAENKMDFYLERDIDYSGVLRDDGTMQVEVKITLRHTAPAATVFPAFVAGNRPDISGGTARNFISLFVPLGAQLQEVLKGGKPTTDFENSPEMGKRRLGTDVEVAPGESRSVTYRYRLPEDVVDGNYRLTVQNQATVKPDTLSIHIQVPANTTITNRKGFGSGEDLVWRGDVRSDQEFSAHLDSPIGSRLIRNVTDFMRSPVAGAASN